MLEERGHLRPEHTGLPRRDGRAWWSIEVLDGEFSARSGQDAHGRDLVRAAIGYGAVDWSRSRFSWGVIFEVCFPDDDLTGATFEAFRDFPAVRAALDAVPVRLLFVYRGRGGSAGSRVPRRPKPAPLAAAAAVPEPDPVEQRIVIGATIETALQL